MTIETFVYYQDPGHGWLRVPETTLAEFGKSEADFSPYSYRDNGHVYLEEDADMTAFLNMWRDRHGVFPALLEQFTDTDHWIRDQRSGDWIRDPDTDHWIRGLDRCSGKNWTSPFERKANA